MTEQHTTTESLDLLDPPAPVRLSVEYPETLSRPLLFVKWLLAIPLFIGAAIYGIGAFVAIFIAFWAILITGRIPDGLFDFLRGFLAYVYKTIAYFPLLMTDQWTPEDLHPLRLQVDPPERSSRWVLLFVQLPSYLLEFAYSIASLGIYVIAVVAIPTWFIILFSGKYPKAIFRLNVSRQEKTRGGT